MAFLVTSILFALAYSYFMRMLFTGFLAYETQQVHSPKTHQGITVVIPFRNEAAHLGRLFKALDASAYPRAAVEIILVDDHSTDESEYLVKAWLTTTPLRAQLLKNTGEGKKEAQRLGVLNAKHELIACTDADCVPPPTWLNAVNAAFATAETAIAFGPVVFNTKASAFQRVEFVALIASTMAMLKNKWAVMGNAANMAFKKTAYLAAEDDIKKYSTPSGDDVFLLHALAKNPAAVGVLAGNEACVVTSGSSSLWAFVQQRLRWASKARYARSVPTVMVGGLVFAVNAYLLCALVLFALGIINQWPFVLLFLVKLNVDFIFIKRVAPFFEQRVPSSIILLQECINLVYVPLIGLFSQVLPYTWKGRRY